MSTCDDKPTGNNHAIEMIKQREAEIERLTERCNAYKGQVEAGSHEIGRLRAALINARTCIEAQMQTESTANALAIIDGALTSPDYVP